MVREFGASPRAADLQKRLEERVAGPRTVNWRWYEAEFMAYRDPLVVYMSYFFVQHGGVRNPRCAKARGYAHQGHAPIQDAGGKVRRGP